MSHVSSALIFASYIPQETKALITTPQRFGRIEGYEQAFAEMDMQMCGGGKFMQADVYAAGLNHVNSNQLVEWFRTLPWGDVGEAVLVFDVEGDCRTVVCTPGWERGGRD